MAKTIHHPGQVVERVRALDKLGAIVIGSADIYVAFDGATRPPEDIDIALNKAAFREACRTHPDWKLTAIPGTDRHHLIGGGFDIGVGWGDRPYDALKEQAWKADGITFAHLADVYAYKQRRDAKSDREDLQEIRSLIHGVDSRPLPARLTTYEQSCISALLSEEINGITTIQQVIELASSGLASTRIVYGDMSQGQVNRIAAKKNDSTYDILAAYHEGGLHTLRGLRWLLRHMTATNTRERGAGKSVSFSEAALQHTLITYSYRNALFGKAKSDSLARTHVESTGITDTSSLLEPQQKDTLRRAMQAADRQELSEPFGLERAYHLAVEHIQLTQLDKLVPEAPDQTVLSPELRIFSPDALFTLADRFPDMRLTTTSPTIKEALLKSMEQVGTMIGPNSPSGYQYPEYWTGERRALCAAHIQVLRRHLHAIDNDQIGFSEAYTEATIRTLEMKTLHPKLA